jgi:gliding motility-associated-like protein
MNTKHLCKIFIICLFLIIAGKSRAQTSTSDSAQMVTFKLNPGSNATLHANTQNAVAFQWYKNNIAVAGAVNKDYVVNKAGIYSVIGFTAQGCSSPQSDNLNVIMLATDSIPSKPDSVKTNPDSTETKQDTAVDLAITLESTNIKARQGTNYSYIINAFNRSDVNGTNVRVTYVIPTLLKYLPSIEDPSVIYNADTRTLSWNIGNLYKNSSQQLNINVSVISSGSIKSMVNITGNQPDPDLSNNMAQVIQQDNSLNIPNVFTPNGDGINDTFYIIGLDAYPQTEIVVMNKAGGTVYNNENYKNDWAGNNLPEGTYFYIIKVKTQTGDWEIYRGYITLLRSRV